MNRLLKIVLLLVVMGALVLAVTPFIVSANSTASAGTSGFGAAFAYSQTIGSVSYTQAGSISNGWANAKAWTPDSSAGSFVTTTGHSAAFAQAIGSPFGTAVQIQVASFFDGSALASAFANP